MDAAMKTPPIVTPQEWEAARQVLLATEKEVTRARDALAAARRQMPWLAVEKEYAFDGPGGRASLLDLFEGRRQLIVYRAFFEPGVRGWPDHACAGCSLVADQVAHVAHLNARDTTLAFASRAPQPDIARVKARMGWEMPWYTMTDEFDADFGVDEWHGTNAFIRDGSRVFRTYFINNRGDEAMGGTWSYLDITALGRQEEWEDSPEGYPRTPPYQWWNWHDEYGRLSLCCRVQDGLDVDDRGLVQGLQGPDQDPRSLDGEDLNPVQPDGVGAVGRTGAEHARERPRRVVAGPGDEHGTVGPVQPGQHDDLGPGADVAQPVGDAGLERQPRPRRALVSLPRRLGAFGKR